MALRFLADHCIPNSIVQTLRDANHEVLRLKDLLPVESPDAVVIAKAQGIHAILLSLNGDFADIVAYPPKNYTSIIALQMRNRVETLPHLMARLTAYLMTFAGSGWCVRAANCHGRGRGSSALIQPAEAPSRANS